MALTAGLGLGSLGGCTLYPPYVRGLWQEEFRKALSEEKQALIEENRKTQMVFYRENSRFYRETADAYFIIGYENYILAKQAQDSEDFESADLYARRAKLYYDLSQQLKQSAAARAEAIEALAAQAPMPGPAQLPPGGAGAAPPMASQPAAGAASSMSLYDPSAASPSAIAPLAPQPAPAPAAGYTTSPAPAAAGYAAAPAPASGYPAAATPSAAAPGFAAPQPGGANSQYGMGPQQPVYTPQPMYYYGPQPGYAAPAAAPQTAPQTIYSYPAGQ